MCVCVCVCARARVRVGADQRPAPHTPGQILRRAPRAPERTRPRPRGPGRNFRVTRLAYFAQAGPEHWAGMLENRVPAPRVPHRVPARTRATSRACKLSFNDGPACFIGSIHSDLKLPDDNADLFYKIRCILSCPLRHVICWVN